MESQSIEQAREELRRLGWWYQHFELPNGLRTGDGAEPAYQPEQRWRLFEPYVPADLTGKSVLDLGGNAGYFSIQMKLRGAARCVLVDPYDEFVAQARFASRQFGVELEIAQEDAHVFCLTCAERFDYVLFLGLFYHLKYPAIVLDRVAEMTKERLFLASNVLGPAAEPQAEKAAYERYTDDYLLENPAFPRLVFIEQLYNSDPTNWWLPNHSALPALLRSAGMQVIARPHSHVIVADPVSNPGKAIYGNLVFPRYGKAGEPTHPGPQKVDPALWAELCQRAEVFRDGEDT
jgi:tRNA (mo5U34)-methyltransferase